MSNDIKERHETKSLDAMFLYELETEFEFSRRTALAVLETTRLIYDLDSLPRSQTPGVIKEIVTASSVKPGTTLRDAKKVEVALTFDAGSEDSYIKIHFGPISLRRARMLRMIDEALEQGGQLSQEDLSRILSVDIRTVRRDIASLRAQGYQVLTRGQLQDLGPATSHKTIIVRHYLEGATYTEIARKTHHSPFAIKRYLLSFQRCLLSHKQGLSLLETAFICGISSKLAKEYLDLYLHCRNLFPERIEDIMSLLAPSSLSSKRGLN